MPVATRHYDIEELQPRALSRLTPGDNGDSGDNGAVRARVAMRKDPESLGDRQ